jgi:hypothetical protein
MDLSQELRLKVSEEMHRLVHAFALANGEEASSLLRHVIQSYLDSEIRKHTLIARLLKGQGVQGE